MSIGSQTRSVLDRLQAGETLSSGAVTLAPLDASTKLLLRVLRKSYTSLWGADLRLGFMPFGLVPVLLSALHQARSLVVQGERVASTYASALV